MDKNSITRKPIHIGMFLYEKRGKVYILTYNHRIVHFQSKGSYFFDIPVVLDKNGHEERFYLFQFKEECQSEVEILGRIIDFALIEVEYYNQAEYYFYGDNPLQFAIIKSKYYDRNVFSYHIDSDYIIKTHTRGGYLNLDGHFTKEENALLNYIYRDKYEELTLKVFMEKKKELIEHVSNLDIKGIVDSYEIKRLERIDVKHDLYYTWVSGLSNVHDKYLDSLLPGTFGYTHTMDVSDDISNEVKEEMSRYIGQEGEIKKRALEVYSKDDHVDILLYNFVKKKEKEKEEYYNKYILPKLMMWDNCYLKEIDK